MKNTNLIYCSLLILWMRWLHFFFLFRIYIYNYTHTFIIIFLFTSRKMPVDLYKKLQRWAWCPWDILQPLLNNLTTNENLLSEVKNDALVFHKSLALMGTDIQCSFSIYFFAPVPPRKLGIIWPYAKQCAVLKWMGENPLLINQYASETNKFITRSAY